MVRFRSELRHCTGGAGDDPENAWLAICGPARTGLREVTGPGEEPRGERPPVTSGCPRLTDLWCSQADPLAKLGWPLCGRSSEAPNCLVGRSAIGNLDGRECDRTISR